MRQCSNCGRWSRCNRMIRSRHGPCRNWMPGNKQLEAAAYILMAIGVGIMWYVAAIYGSGEELTWQCVIAILIGAGIAVVGDMLLKAVEKNEA